MAHLLHHVHALPYRDRRGNAAGSASAVALVVVATINLLRAGFEAAEYVPRGPNAYLMNCPSHETISAQAARQNWPGSALRTVAERINGEKSGRPTRYLMNVLEEVENCLMLWLPGAVMGFVVLLLTAKLVYLAVHAIYARCCCRC